MAVSIPSLSLENLSFKARSSFVIFPGPKPRSGPAPCGVGPFGCVEEGHPHHLALLAPDYDAVLGELFLRLSIVIPMNLLVFNP